MQKLRPSLPPTNVSESWGALHFLRNNPKNSSLSSSTVVHLCDPSEFIERHEEEKFLKVTYGGESSAIYFYPTTQNSHMFWGQCDSRRHPSRVIYGHSKESLASNIHYNALLARLLCYYHLFFFSFPGQKINSRKSRHRNMIIIYILQNRK